MSDAAPRRSRKPEVSALTDEECRIVLRRNHVGRIAFVRGGRVDIQPVHYVASDSWLYVRSAEGTKLEAFAHVPYVAFEVDEVDSTFDWRSVVAHGTIYMMSSHGSTFDRADFERALAALRTFIPAALTDDDPTPFRQTIYGLHVDQLSGRMSWQRARAFSGRPVERPPARSRARRVPDGF